MRPEQTHVVLLGQLQQTCGNTTSYAPVRHTTVIFPLN